MDRPKRRRVPVWVMIIIIAAALPVLGLPYLLSAPHAAGEESKVFYTLYPVYVVASAYLAWQCYGRRTVMTWILVGLMLLAHGAMLLLATAQ